MSLLQRHLETLKAVAENEPIGIGRLSEMLKCSNHKARYSLRILQQEGLVRRTPEGALTTDSAKAFLRRLNGMVDEFGQTVRTAREALD